MMIRLLAALAALLALPACRTGAEETSPASKTTPAAVDEHRAPAPKPEEPAMSSLPIIRTAADIEPNAGKRVVLEATIKRLPLSKGRNTFVGTVLLLEDGTQVWVTYGAPPPGWETSLDTPVTVEATLWNGPPPGPQQSLVAPHISTWSEPTPR